MAIGAWFHAKKRRALIIEDRRWSHEIRWTQIFNINGKPISWGKYRLADDLL